MTHDMQEALALARATGEHVRRRLIAAGEIVHTLEAMWEDGNRGVNRFLPEQTYVDILARLVAAWKESE